MMKMTIRTIVLSLAVVTMSNVAFAGKSEKAGSEELNVQIKTLVDTQVAVIFEKLEGELVRVQIYDADGKLVFLDRAKKGTAYLKKFNLEQLPAGTYTYKVSNDVFSMTKNVELK